jgi:lipopolysaccharide/colanic/teichoic acid biosynthesis glycosyltransferase
LEVVDGEVALRGPREELDGASSQRRFDPNGDGARQVMGYSMEAVATVDTALELDEALPLAAHNPLAAAIKRTFDVVISALAIIVLTPLWLAIAVAIKLDTPGPVLFRQRRIGRNGRSFRMLKFRTMVNGADEQKGSVLHLNEAGAGLFKITGDPRMTRVGRFLRPICLDELPQLLHVLTGQMSLVGPRPLVPEEDERVHGTYRRRLTMRPGITGVWQIAGAGRWIPLGEMAEMDADYVDNWSLIRDLEILWRTAPLVVRRAGV